MHKYEFQLTPVTGAVDLEDPGPEKRGLLSALSWIPKMNRGTLLSSISKNTTY